MSLVKKIIPFFLIFSFISIASIQANEYTNAAKKNLDASFTAILNLIKDPNFSNPSTKPKSLKKIEVEIKKLFDFSEFSSRATGKAWSKFSPKQKIDFTNSFANLLIYTYLSKIKNYNGEQIIYTDSRSANSGKFVEIGTIIDLNNGQKIPVAYRMLSKNNSWVVYDVIVERISLVKNFRTQFHDILTKTTTDELIANIQAKAQEVQKAQE